MKPAAATSGGWLYRGLAKKGKAGPPRALRRTITQASGRCTSQSRCRWAGRTRAAALLLRRATPALPRSGRAALFRPPPDVLGTAARTNGWDLQLHLVGGHADDGAFRLGVVLV